MTFVSALWFLACSSDSEGGACDEGDKGCACYPNQTCNGDLDCNEDEKCVSPDDGSGGDSGSGGNGGSSGDNGDDGGSGGSGGTDSGGSGGGSTNGSGGASTNGSGGGSTTGSGGSGASDTNSTASSTTSGDPPADSPVSVHGQLRLDGQQLVDESGDAVQLKGVSSMWLNWDPTGYAENLEGLRWMRDNWGLTIIRAAMGVDAEGAYLEDPAKAKSQVRTIIQNAIAAGVYVLVDWHDHEADLHQDESEAFFDEISSEYGDVPNVLYELWNEPLDVSWTGALKPYHEAVSSVVRANDPDNVIILGTSNWSQDVDIAAESPVAGTNLMYTLHFYACSHGADLRAKASAAYDLGLPLFVTEWGASDADGGVDGIVCEADAQAWHDWLDPRGISWAAWKLDGCTDSTCFFKDQTAPVTGGWDETHLNGHAPFVIERMLADNPYLDDVVEPPTCEPTGTCAAGDGMDCSPEDEPVERDCSSCALLSCGESCCASISYFGANDYPFLERPELITGFTAGATEATLEAAFDSSGELAAITFKLDQAYAIDPSYVTVTLDAAGTNVVPASDVSVSLENGSAGCKYPIAFSSGQTAVLNYTAPYCWEGFTTSSPVTQVNVRLLSYAAGSASLSVYGLSL